MADRFRHPKPLTLTMTLALVLVAIGPTTPVASAERTVPDVNGAWAWNELVIITAPGDVVAALFGVEVEGPVMHVQCRTWGGLTIQQNGSSFTGSADQQWSCDTQGGQSAQTAPFPPGFDVSGSIRGHAIDFSADVGQGFSCSYNGALQVNDDVATSLKATGGCDIPAPFHPNMDKSVSFDAVRQ